MAGNTREMNQRGKGRWICQEGDRGVQVVKVQSWHAFVDFIREEHANCPALVYRGQANADWKVESTLDRMEKRYPRKRNFAGRIPREFECTPADRDEHLRAFKEVVRGRRGSNPPQLSEEEWWALGQQHGLATPLLDWAYSPFVAMFFAFEQGHVSPGDGKRDDASPSWAVFSLSTSLMKTIRERDPAAPALFLPRKETSYRVVSQRGLFLWMPEGKDLEGWIQEFYSDEGRLAKMHFSKTDAMLQKIVIPATNDDRIECLKFLNKMNINRASLFPDLDGAARYVNALWELDFDTGLGFIPDHIESGEQGEEDHGLTS